jgi:hypothetical protein
MPSIARFDQWQNSAGTTRSTILQVREASNTTIISTSSNAEGDIVTVSITPFFSNSKILLYGNYSAGINSGSPNATMHFGRTISGSTTYPGRFTDSSRIGGVVGAEIAGNTGAGESMSNLSGYFLDSPATTSAITYSLRYAVYDGSLTVGRVSSTSDATWASRTRNTIIVMEIAQ